MDWGLQRLDESSKLPMGRKQKQLLGELGGKVGGGGMMSWFPKMSGNDGMAKIGMFYWHPETGQLNLITHTSSDLWDVFFQYGDPCQETWTTMAACRWETFWLWSLQKTAERNERLGARSWVWKNVFLAKSSLFWVFFVHIFAFPQGLWDFWVFMVNLTADPTVGLRSFLSYRRTDARRKNTATTHVTCRSKFVFKKRDSTIQLWYTWMMRLTLVFSMLLHPRIFYDFHIQGF